MVLFFGYTNLVGSLEDGMVVEKFLLAKHNGSYSSLLMISRKTVPLALHVSKYRLNNRLFWESSFFARPLLNCESMSS